VPTEFKITFHKIEKCGIYAPGKPPNLQVMGIKELLPGLCNWIDSGSKPIEETATFEPNEDDNILPVYCLSVDFSQNGDALITTWNKSAEFNGKTLSIEGNKPATTAQVRSSNVPKNSIPGYPTYFWFLPNEGVYATITYNTTLNGNPGLQKYLSNFLHKFTKYTTWKDDNPDTNTIEILGYDVAGCENLFTNSFGAFKSSLYPRPSQAKLLLARFSEIKKIKRKEILRSGTNDPKFMSSIMAGMGIIDDTPPSDLKVEYTAYKTFTKEEIQQILDNYKDSNKDKWDDVGFYLQGSQTPIWASHSTSRDTFKLDVSGIENPILDRNSLLSSLEIHKDRILKILD
jgi:hypothetical protein